MQPKFVTVDYICESTPQAKFCFKNPFTGDFWANRRSRPILVAIFLFWGTRIGQTSWRILTFNCLKYTESRKDVPFGVRIFNFSIWFQSNYPKNVKFWPQIGNFQPKCHCSFLWEKLELWPLKFKPLNPWTDCHKVCHSWLRPQMDTSSQFGKKKSIHGGLLGK